jgi:hypothetical protein
MQHPPLLVAALTIAVADAYNLMPSRISRSSRISMMDEAVKLDTDVTAAATEVEKMLGLASPSERAAL